MISTTPGSAVTARAVAFVAERRGPAETLGGALSEWTNDPDAFAGHLRDGLTGLADPDYLDGQRRVAPGLGSLFGVRWPLLAAGPRGCRQGTRDVRPTPLLFLAHPLCRQPAPQMRSFPFGLR